MQVLVFSEHEFLTGIVDSYCHVLGCCKVKPINNINDLLTTTIIKPSVIFVDIELAEKFLTSPLWEDTWQSLQENKVVFCGVGKQQLNENEAAQWPVFNEFFTLPLNIDKVHDFLHDRMFPIELVKKERRSSERRGADRRRADRRMGGRRIGDRRKQVETLSSENSPLDHEYALNNQQKSDQTLRVGSLHIDFHGKEVSVDGSVVEISPKEFEIIDLLAHQPGCVVKTEDIVKTIWPKNYKATKADAHQYIHLLRKKIEKNPHEPQLLVTVKGFGYKLCS